MHILKGCVERDGDNIKDMEGGLWHLEIPRNMKHSVFPSCVKNNQAVAVAKAMWMIIYFGALWSPWNLLGHSENS